MRKPSRIKSSVWQSSVCSISYETVLNSDQFHSLICFIARDAQSIVNHPTLSTPAFKVRFMQFFSVFKSFSRPFMVKTFCFCSLQFRMAQIQMSMEAAPGPFFWYPFYKSYIIDVVFLEKINGHFCSVTRSRVSMEHQTIFPSCKKARTSFVQK